MFSNIQKMFYFSKHFRVFANRDCSFCFYHYEIDLNPYSLKFKETIKNSFSLNIKNYFDLSFLFLFYRKHQK